MPHHPFFFTFMLLYPKLTVGTSLVTFDPAGDKRRLKRVEIVVASGSSTVYMGPLRRRPPFNTIDLIHITLDAGALSIPND